MMFRKYRGRIPALSAAVLWFISSGNEIADAFDAKDIGRTKRPTDHTRRTALGRISFLTLANFGVVLSPKIPSYALEDEKGDLSLAQPMGPSGDSRPSAPLEFLLPAARVGVYIYQLFSFTEQLVKLQQDSADNASTEEQKNVIAKLDALLLSPPSFINAKDPSVSRSDPYGKNSLPIVGELGVAARKQQERRERAIDVGFAPQFFEVGELVGERRQWNQLQSSERKREGASEVRRAFNIYTTNLNFNSNKYQWVGSSQEKSQRIRSDKLPTTTDVIRSDLDARDLYRNQVQTSLDDAVAEFVYQKKESGDNVQKFDATELLDILKQAQTSVDKWFGFIPDQDVKSALEAVQREQA